MRLAPCSTWAAALAGAICLTVATPAFAQSIIKNPGDHRNSVEIEPHLLLRPFDTYAGDLGLGLGLRLSIPLFDNGFIPSINNSIALGVGFDWMRLDACDGRYDNAYFTCGKLNIFTIPVVMQWNFFLTRSWSVFGEPGLLVNFYSNRCGGYNDPQGRHFDNCPNYNTIEPTVFIGARWHFGASTALTFRVGWPYVSVGVSFL